jgi:hypothetical protein
MIVDIVMPFHRMDSFLFQAIDSVNASVGIEPRLILVDDRLDTRVPLSLKLKRGQILKSGGVGYAEALRLGLREVQSTFFAFQDSDDLTDRRRISSQVQGLVDSDADVSICGLSKIGIHGHRKFLQPPQLVDANIVRISNLLGSLNSNSSWVCRSTVLELPEFMPAGFESIDWATTLSLPNRIKFEVLAKRKYLYRNHSKQMTKESSYLAESFREIFPKWASLNKDLKLPEVSLHQAAAIAAPWSSDLYEAIFPTEWVISFFNLEEIRNSPDYFALRKIIARRVMQNKSSTRIEKFRFLRRLGYLDIGPLSTHNK